MVPNPRDHGRAAQGLDGYTGASRLRFDDLAHTRRGNIASRSTVSRAEAIYHLAFRTEFRGKN